MSEAVARKERRGPLEMIADAKDDPLKQAGLVAGYITTWQQKIDEVIALASDKTVEILSLRGLVTEEQKQLRAALKAAAENRESTNDADDIFREPEPTGK